ncbi:hypothetical protein OPKNFCMD_3174 [Methylobacterium crusticola]|uniref:histidine kinase n=1 Tax=Methylobacterium crusticola TaxID=1697972 RepID=A0ABQ4QZZ9_9HYPH|nr:PAS domain-containing protein [Methylobacterium crusticola]GJD50435.1 hypothetical protein OPKNFCMD_3174 [Methylobacterium crusticola]
MNAANLAFSSREFLRLIERHGLAGTWGWTFATDRHVWSEGLYRLLGIGPGDVRPSYGGLRTFVHPEDRPGLETALQVMQEGALREHTVRVIRPDGSLRVVVSRGRVGVAPDGRPQRAAGVLLDITDRGLLARAQAAERQRRWELFERTRRFTVSITSEVMESSFTAQPGELTVLTGIPGAELKEDAFQVIVVEEREFQRDERMTAKIAGRISIATSTLLLAGGERSRFTSVSVPIRDLHGAIVEWCAVAQPAAGADGAAIPDRVREGLEQAVEGRHLRAARALLDWSMIELAAAAGLSLSTVRRLEENAEAAAARSRHAAVAALRGAGIRFVVMPGGSIAVGRR